jgi:hypothetical protein
MYPTPAATPYGSQQNGVCSSKPSAGTPSLETWSRSWASPQASDPTSGPAHERGNLKLTGQAKQWPTPCTTDSRAAGRHTTTTDVMHPGTSLTDAIRSSTAWQTPVASRSGWNDRGEPKLREQAKLSGSALQQWPTPTAGEGTGYMSGTNRDTWRPTLASAAKGSRPSPGRPRPTTAPPGPPSSPSVPTSPRPSRRVVGNVHAKKTAAKEPTLNPLFVTWLQGLPLGSAAAGASRFADRVDQLRCLGNVAVPCQAELAIVTLLERALA